MRSPWATPARWSKHLFTASLMSVMGLAVWAFALLRRSRRETLAALHDRADRLERERDQQHQLVRALSTIGDTGRAALADMRRILGVLRAGHAGDAAASGGSALTPVPAPVGSDLPLELAPQPTTDDLETLLDQVRSVGIQVSSVEVGEPRPLPAGMSLTVHRICQEALTNVLKHAGPAPNVTLLRRWGRSTLVLERTTGRRPSGGVRVDEGPCCDDRDLGGAPTLVTAVSVTRRPAEARPHQDTRSAP